MIATTLRRFRRWVQLAAFLLFLYLLLWAGRLPFLRADLFFLADPLTGLANTLAARHIVAPILIGGVLAFAFALVLGRAWCGWLCPMGTILDWTPSRHTKRYDPDPAHWLRALKYFLLILLLAAAVFGALAFLILDPITLVYRALTTAVWPALLFIVFRVESLLYQAPLLRGAVDAFETVFRGRVMPIQQPYYAGNVLMALVFAAILALNAVRERFWCRYLCPLGALLGLVSKVALLRRTVGTACIECQRCARACPTGTIDPARHFESDPSECIMCLECAPTCSRAGQTFAAHLGAAAWQSYDPSRRQFLAATGAALATVGLFGAERASGRDDAHLIRPPGAAKPEFLSQCIRCGICLKVCPTSGLQPSLQQAGWAGFWTPVLTPRLGHCDYGCNACGQACPVGAIPPLPLEEKQITVIGHAYIDRSRCIPWVDNRNCLVCEEMCPTPEKAILLDEVTARAADGTETRVLRPYVVHERCIGCGICENRCPLNGEAAIRVYPPSELTAVG